MSSEFQVVQLNGSFDITMVAKFRQQIDAMVAAGAQAILIDLKEVTFMDSSGLGALVTALKMLRARDGKLYLCSMNDQIRMLFDLTGLNTVFDTYRTREEFDRVVLAEASPDS
ncbi:MAG: STAS domain-containing protein [Cyanobacteria bacterium J06642_2]